MSAATGKEDRALYEPALQLLARERLLALSEEAGAALLARLRGGATLYGGAGEAREMGARAPFGGAALAAEVEAHPPFGRLQPVREPLIRAGLTTASVPRPVPIAWSRGDLDREAALGARFLWRAGARARSRCSDCLEGGLVAPGTLAVSDALDALDALALPVGPITSEAGLARVREVWEIVQPSVLIVDAPSLAFLEGAGALSDGGAVVALLRPEDREPLRAPSRPGRYRILSIPQLCTFTAGECSALGGYHVAEDDLAIEVVDPESKKPLPDGRQGLLLATTLRRSLVLLRFDTGLLATLDRSPCACGETHARLRFT